MKGADAEGDADSGLVSKPQESTRYFTFQKHLRMR